MASAIALSQRLQQLAADLDRYTAPGHQDTVRLAAQVGSVKPGQSFIREQAPPLKAMHEVLATAVNALQPDAALADAQQRSTAGKGRLPHAGAPVVHLDGQAGLALAAAADVQLAAAETVTLAAGRHTQLASGGHTRLHTGQAIGVLGGTFAPGRGPSGPGLEFITTQQHTDIQAQSNRFELGAKKNTLIESTEGHVDIASPTKISISNTAGANITIEGGGIVVQCPGTITVLSARRSFLAPSGVSYGFPVLPNVAMPPAGPFVGRYELFKLDNRPFDGYAYEIRELGHRPLASGLTDSAGYCEWVQTDQATVVRAYKSVMRESERITEDWAGKLAAAGQG